MLEDWFQPVQGLQGLKPAKEVRLILGDQLNAMHSWFRGEPEPEVIYVMMEMRQETDYAPHHLQKVVAFFGAMRLFASERASADHRIFYLTLDDSRNLQSLTDNLDWIISDVEAKRVTYQLPDEYRLDEQLSIWGDAVQDRGLEIAVADTEHFYTQREELALFFKGKKTYRLENFYRAMRKKHEVLMTALVNLKAGAGITMPRTGRNCPKTTCHRCH